MTALQVKLSFRKANKPTSLSACCGESKRSGYYAIALMAADRRLLWRAALFL
jgi:hypothetical protein